MNEAFNQMDKDSIKKEELSDEKTHSDPKDDYSGFIKDGVEVIDVKAVHGIPFKNRSTWDKI